jgi:hypothetical protein
MHYTILATGVEWTFQNSWRIPQPEDGEGDDTFGPYKYPNYTVDSQDRACFHRFTNHSSDAILNRAIMEAFPSVDGYFGCHTPTLFPAGQVFPKKSWFLHPNTLWRTELWCDHEPTARRYDRDFDVLVRLDEVLGPIPESYLKFQPPEDVHQSGLAFVWDRHDHIGYTRYIWNIKPVWRRWNPMDYQ